MFASFWDAKTARILFTTLVMALVLAFLYLARETLTLFLFAILFAYLMDPLVAYLEKPLRGRGQAIAAVTLLLVGFLVAIGAKAHLSRTSNFVGYYARDSEWSARIKKTSHQNSKSSARFSV